MDNDTLHSLLARGHLSGAQRDEILERVLQARAARGRARAPWAIAIGIVLPAAALVALVISTTSDKPAPGWLVPKGDSRGPVIEAHCPGRGPGQCQTGDRLIFSVNGLEKGGFFSAYAVCGSAERIWYFPRADGQLPTLPAQSGYVVVDQAARIGPEHGLGSCQLHVSVLAERASRAAVLSGNARTTGNAVLPLTITR